MRCSYQGYLISLYFQSKDKKRFKDNLKEEEKLAVRKVEVSVSKADKKVVMNQTKLELQSKRTQKVRDWGYMEEPTPINLAAVCGI